MFKTIFPLHNKIVGGTKNVLEALIRNIPRGYGPDFSTKLHQLVQRLY